MKSELRMSRRSFVGVAAGTASVMGAGLLATCEDPTSVQLAPRFGKGGNGKGGGKGGGASPRKPLRIPTSRAADGTTLVVGPDDVDVGFGTPSRLWAYNGQFPGPTLIANRGEQVSLTLVNQLADETITHWHGMIVDTPNDGHPAEAIDPGASYFYDFPVVQRATMNWYHPHPHEKTGEQVAMGLAGAFIIRDAEEVGLDLPIGVQDREVPLIIRDASFDRHGDMQYKPRSGGFEGNTPLVNGTVDPTLSVQSAIYRLRVLNGCNARIFRFALSDGTPLHLIGNDGGLLSQSAALTEILLGPAERLDLLVDFGGHSVGDAVMLRDLDAGWDLLEFTVDFAVNDTRSVPGSLSTVPSLSDPVREREFSFDGMSKINGRVYDVGRIDFQVPRGQTELWRFSTAGNAPHPVHVHGAYFQVVSRTGGRGDQVFAWERGWKDTVLLQDGETVEVLTRFDDYLGTYLMHCHKLEHEDMGMMSNFEVVSGAAV